KKCWRPAVTSCSRSWKAGPRWLIIWRLPAARTGSGSGVGPGIRNCGFWIFDPALPSRACPERSEGARFGFLGCVVTRLDSFQAVAADFEAEGGVGVFPFDAAAADQEAEALDDQGAVGRLGQQLRAAVTAGGHDQERGEAAALDVDVGDAAHGLM